MLYRKVGNSDKPQLKDEWSTYSWSMPFLSPCWIRISASRMLWRWCIQWRWRMLWPWGSTSSWRGSSGSSTGWWVWEWRGKWGRSRSSSGPVRNACSRGKRRSTPRRTWRQGHTEPEKSQRPKSKLVYIQFFKRIQCITKLNHAAWRLLLTRKIKNCSLLASK